MEKQAQHQVKHLSNEKIWLRIKQALNLFDPTNNYTQLPDVKVQQSAFKIIEELIRDLDKQENKGGLTAEHKPLETKSYKIYFINQLGNLYYRIKRFEDADNFYSLLEKEKGFKITDEVYRQRGDCKRQLQDYAKAAQYYQKGKQISKNKQIFTYSLGLLDLAKGDYNNAAVNFKEARNQASKQKDYASIILYGCAEILAYFSDQTYFLLNQKLTQFKQKSKSDPNFKTIINTKKLYGKSLESKISSQNLNFIQSILDGNLMDQVNTFVKKSKPEDMKLALREYYQSIFKNLQTIIQNPQGKQEIEIDNRIQLDTLRQKINKATNDKQYDNYRHIYNSMKNEFHRHIGLSQASTWNIFQKAEKNTWKGQIGANIVSYLPYVSVLQPIILHIDELIKQKKEIKIYNSINELSQNCVQIQKVVEKAILLFIHKNKEQLFNQTNLENAIKERILPNWLKTFEPFVKLVKAQISTIKQKLFGKQQEPNPIKQYGIKLVNSFLAEKIVSQDYKKHNFSKDEQRRDYIQKSFTQIFKRDFGIVEK